MLINLESTDAKGKDHITFLMNDSSLYRCGFVWTHALQPRMHVRYAPGCSWHLAIVAAKLWVCSIRLCLLTAQLLKGVCNVQLLGRPAFEQLGLQLTHKWPHASR